MKLRITVDAIHHCSSPIITALCIAIFSRLGWGVLNAMLVCGSLSEIIIDMETKSIISRPSRW